MVRKKDKFSIRPIYIFYLAIIIVIIAYFAKNKESNQKETPKPVVSTDFKQEELYKDWGFPPSKAQMLVKSPVFSLAQANTKLFQMGLTADDLQPIDWREKVELSPIINQFDCGNCWAMAAVSVLADRFIIQKDLGIEEPLQLEPVIATQCVPTLYNRGCDGGYPNDAGVYFENYGLPMLGSQCKKYADFCPKKIKNNTSVIECNIPSCNSAKNLCQNQAIFKAKKGSTKSLNVISGNRVDIGATIINIQRDLLDGPVVACFYVPKDFMAGGVQDIVWRPTNGIYVRGFYNSILNDREKFHPGLAKQMGAENGDWSGLLPAGATHAAHAVCIVGWGRGNAGPAGDNVPYWIVRNSWGPNWGENGYCRVAFGNYKVSVENTKKFKIPETPNRIMYFDIPQIDSQGRTFGGCLSFDPDLSTGIGENRSEDEIKDLKKENAKITAATTTKGLISVWPILLGTALIIYVIVSMMSDKKKKK